MRKGRHSPGARAWIPAAALASILALLPLSPPAGAAAGAGLDEELAAISALIENDDYTEALRRAGDVAARFPGSAEALALHALALQRAGAFAPAEAESDRALALDPACADALLAAGRLAMWTNRIERARDLLLKATASSRFSGEAYRDLSRLHAEQGDFAAAASAAKEALARSDDPSDGRARSAIAYYEFLGSERYFRIAGDFTRTTVKLLPEPGAEGSRLRLVSILVNGKGPWSFHVDSASPFNLIVSPKLAAELGLAKAGSFSVGGVGPARREIEGSFLDEIRIGEMTMKKVPVTIMDSPTFRGETGGLVGTGLLRKFNVTIDPAAGTMDLFRLDAPRLLEESVREASVVARVPIYHSGTPVVPVAVGDGPPEPFILDTAASVTLLGREYLDRHLASSVDGGALEKVQIQGLGGAEETLSVPSATLRIGAGKLEDVRVLVMDMDRMTRPARKYAAGVLGNNVLWGYRIHLDYAGSELILEAPMQSGSSVSPGRW